MQKQSKNWPGVQYPLKLLHICLTKLAQEIVLNKNPFPPRQELSLEFFFSRWFQQGIRKLPSFTQQLQSKDVIEGESVRLEVQVKGIPAPSIKWFQNDDELESTMDMQIVNEGDKSALYIPEVFDQDEGDYTVKAENSAGMASSQARLVVKRKWGMQPASAHLSLLAWPVTSTMAWPTIIL